MGMLDDVMGAANSISGSALAVDGMLRTQLGPAYSQISALLEQGVGADGIMRKNDMQNLANILQTLPQQGAGSSDGSTAKQAKMLMMIVQINALRVQLRNLEDDLEELKRAATGPGLGDVHAVQRDINSIPSGTAEDARIAQRLAAQQNDMFLKLSEMMQQRSDTTKSIIGNMR